MNQRSLKLSSKKSNEVFLRVFPGHFATNHSHINFYIDMTTLKSRKSEAQGAANYIAQRIAHNTIVDTILCLDGTEVIGAFLADALQNAGFYSVNEHKTIYVVSPECDSSGRIIFRDNNKFMVEKKNVLILQSNVTTGLHMERVMECIKYYGGVVSGITALFSNLKEHGGYQIASLFDIDDLPEYRSYPYNQCPMCAAKKKITAMVNSYGYSEI